MRSSPITSLRNCCASSGVNRRSAARTSVSCPRLRSRASGSGGSARVATPGAAGREVVEQEGQASCTSGAVDDVVVVEHEDHCAPGAAAGGAGHVVDERGQRGGRVARRDSRTAAASRSRPTAASAATRWVRSRARSLSPSSSESQATRTCVCRSPSGEPVAEHRGLAEAGRRGHQGEPVARLQGGVEPLEQPWARDQLRAPGRREQLGGEHRSRHPRIIGAPRRRCDRVRGAARAAYACDPAGGSGLGRGGTRVTCLSRFSVPPVSTLRSRWWDGRGGSPGPGRPRGPRASRAGRWSRPLLR